MIRTAVVSLLLLAACTARVPDPEEPIPESDGSEVRRAAERDLDCAPEDITVARVDDPDREVFVAAGCGLSRKYTVLCTSSSRGASSGRMGSSSSSSTHCSAHAIDDEDDYGLDYEEDDE